MLWKPEKLNSTDLYGIALRYKKEKKIKTKLFAHLTINNKRENMFFVT